MADEAKLIAVVEANTKQLENALKRVERMTTGSTANMARSFKNIDKEVATLSTHLSRLRIPASFGGGLGGAARFGIPGIIGFGIKAAIQDLAAHSEELRRAGRISDETARSVGRLHMSLSELGTAAANSGRSVEGAFADVISPAIDIAIGQVDTLSQELQDLGKILNWLAQGEFKKAFDLGFGGVQAPADVAADRISGAFGAAGGAGVTSTTRGQLTKGRGEVRQLQGTLAATRNLPVSAELLSILEHVARTQELIVEVVSGGQPAKGSGGKRTGSVRHDLGGAADVRFRDPLTGRLLSVYDPGDVPLIAAAMQAAAAGGATGLGAGPGYMGGLMYHIGMGRPGVWGAGGRSATAPDWLQQAFRTGASNPAFVPGREAARLSANEAAAADKQAAADDAAKEAAEKEKKRLEEVNRLEEERNRFYYERALKSGEITDQMKEQANAINESMAFNRDLVGGFVKDLERGVKPAEALANAMQKIGDRLLDMALQSIFPDVVAGAAGGGGIGGIIGKLFGFEAGGVMTGRGPLPLKRYAGGGVANSPQLAMYGEGSRPEAYVPLPDGRAIPVRMRGDMPGRQRVDVAVHPSPMFITTTQVVAEQAGHRAVASAGDNARRRAGGR